MTAARAIAAEMRAAFAALTQPGACGSQRPLRGRWPPGAVSAPWRDAPEATNIKPYMAKAFAALVTASETDAPFVLSSCFVNGEPTAAIGFTHEGEDGSITVYPLFVFITPSMVLTDHHGRTAGEGGQL